MKQLRLCAMILSVAASLAGSSASAEDLIIETSPNGQNFAQYREMTGKWIDSRIPPSVAKSTAPGLTAPGVCGSRKTLLSGPNVVTTAPASARFFPRFASPGRYHVYVTWPRGANATHARYVIHHTRGENVVDLAQNGWGAPPLPCNAGIWISLGAYEFETGDDQYVELRSEAGAHEIEERWYGQIYADAVRFSSEPLEDLGQPLPPEAPPAPQGKELPLQVQARPIVWEQELDSAWQRAQREHRSVLLFFSLPSSPRCASIQTKLLSLPEIRAALESKCILVQLNYAEFQDLAAKLGVYRANVLNLYNSRGEAIAQLSDNNTAQEFLEALKRL